MPEITAEDLQRKLQSAVNPNNGLDLVGFGKFSNSSDQKTSVLYDAIRRVRKDDYETHYETKINNVIIAFHMIYENITFSKEIELELDECTIIFYPIAEGYFLFFIQLSIPSPEKIKNLHRTIILFKEVITDSAGDYIAEVDPDNISIKLV